MTTLTSPRELFPTPPRPLPVAGRLHLLDGLRLFAAAAVVAFHFTALDVPHWGVPTAVLFPDISVATTYGAFGVQLFFVISGFVVLMSAWGRSIPNFVASRVARIYPAYWAAVALTVVLFGLLWPGGRDVSVAQALVNLTMMQTAFGVEDLDGVYWTLWVELCFYALIAVFMRLGITTARVLVFCAAWPVLATFAYGSENILVISLLMPRHAPFFAGGMLLYLLYREGHSLVTWLLLAFTVVFAGQSLHRGYANKVEAHTGYDLPAVAPWLVAVTCFGLVALVTLTRLRTVDRQWLPVMGLLTYPLYLVHQYWGLWVIDLLHPALPARLVVVLAVAGSLLLAWAVHRLVERPFARRFRRSIESGIERMAAPAGGEPRRRSEPPATTGDARGADMVGR